MRAAEWINLCTFAAFVVMASLFRLSPHRRRRALLLSSAGILLVLSSIYLAGVIPGSASARDWLPALLILFAYWTGGAFVSIPDERLQQTLMRFDEWLLKKTRAARTLSNPTLHAYLEFTYLFCYPLIPAGVAVLYLHGMQERVDDYWSVVLPSTYACYLIQPLARALPPRLVAPQPKDEHNQSVFRRLNLWIHRRASIRFITLPSAHVASTMAASLVLCFLVPTAGALFLALSLSIALAAVVERYHYAADVLLGAAVAIVVVLTMAPKFFT